MSLIGPDEGHPLPAGPTRPVVKVGPRMGSHLLAVMESEVLPGGGFPKHVHDEYEGVFYVLDGALEYFIDGAWRQAVAGTTVFIPSGQIHGFRNTSDTPARHLALTSPALVGTMIEELTRAAAGEVPSVLTRYGSHLEP